MKRRLVFFFVMMIALASTVMAAKKSFTLVIDAGHGGRDTGALGSYSKEKDINLKVALEFGRLVEANCPDVKVIYTRKSDMFVALHQRADIANKNKADLFVSIHTNALPKGKKATGLETYTLGMHRASDNLDVAMRENSVILIEKDYKQHYEGFDPNSSESYILFEVLQDKNMAQSVELAKFVQKRTCAAAGRPDKGVKQAGFLVLRETSMPSCLIELGFITTPGEEKFLNTKSGVESLAKGIYQAFVDYRNKYGTASAVTFETPKTVADPKASVTPKATPKAETAKVPSVVPKEKKSTAESKSKKRNTKASSVIEQLAEARRNAAADPVLDNLDDTDGDEANVGIRSDDNDVDKGKDKKNSTDGSNEEDVEKEKTEVSDAGDEPDAMPVAPDADAEEPVFKVQILASDTKLKTNNLQFKGEGDIDCYQEGAMYKYTKGASTDYNEIYRLRKTLVDKFPDAFIIAFKNGKRTDVKAAIQEFKNNRNKQ